MTNNTNLEIVNRMVANGYHLMTMTAEEMAQMFDTDTLLDFERSFNQYKENN